MSFTALDTGPSNWAPLAMIAGMLIILFIVFIIRAFGKKDFKYSKDKAMPFYSGNIVTEKSRVKASDYFWGFFEAFKNYYSWMKSIHSGIVNDYIFWFVTVASIILIALALGVVQ